MILTLTCILLLSVYAVLILYYAYSWRQIPATHYPSGSTALVNESRPTVSVIIPARNEAANILACVQSVLQQSYPTDLYEIIVVDDFSSDDTVAIVKNIPATNLRIISLSEIFNQDDTIVAFKKKAIATGIAQSSGQLIVATDADCVLPEHWLAAMVSFCQLNNAVFIAAPVLYKAGNRFVEIFQSLDFMTLQGITGASVYKKFHTMCNGANLAYKRSAFNEVDGFNGIDHIASGDDMLLMYKIYQRYPDQVCFLKAKEAIVVTQPMHTWKDFINQRIRWASKASQFQDKRMFWVLLWVYLTNLLFPVLAVAGFFNASYWYLLCILLLAKTGIELVFLFPVAAFFKQTRLLWWFPVSQPVHILYTLIAGWFGKFGRYEWKGRKTGVNL
jgi:poly-beta-1,6-N-acetyl-D-glucosamine synthase